MINRRNLLKTSIAAGTVAATGGAIAALAKKSRYRVAFMLGDNTNVIDTAGPWEVFQDVVIGVGPASVSPFELFTVGKTRAPVRMTGGFQAIPHYGVADSPQPDVIVVPAHRTDADLQAWLSSASKEADVTMAICTGAFKLAELGMLDGLRATTHHDFWDTFEKRFPKVQLERGFRFIDQGRIATAGGLTSGIDLALHVVDRYFGEEVAAAAATYMEHDSEGWRTGRRS